MIRITSMKQKLPLTFFCYLLCTYAYCQSALKYSNAFMDIGVDARSLAMANSVVANVKDVTAGYWNPAGLVNITGDLQFSFMHDDYFAGIAEFDYASVAARIDKNSVAALSVIRFGVDDIPNTIDLIDANGNINYNNITTFSAADYGFLGSYSRRFDAIPGLTVGGNVKVLRQIIGSFAGAWGFGFDGGAQYSTNDWLFGAMARDITSTFNAWSYSLSQDMEQVFAETGNSIPTDNLEITLPELILGAGRNFNIYRKKVTLLAELDADITFDGKENALISTNPVSVEPHAGVEVTYKNIVFLRLGIGNFQQATDVTGAAQTYFQPDFGVGVKIKSFALDYALTSLGNVNVAPYSNVFSIKFDVNRKKR